jgi:hypothetical protein
MFDFGIKNSSAVFNSKEGLSVYNLILAYVEPVQNLFQRKQDYKLLFKAYKLGEDSSSL